MPGLGLRYHIPVKTLVERVVGHIRQHELLKPGDRLGVAVSGGIDSVALLRLLLVLRRELGIVLSVVHFNHKLRGTESEADQEFVAALARQFSLEFHVDSDDVAGHAAEEGISLEAAARELRYGFFRHLIREVCPQGLKPSAFISEPDRSALNAAPPEGHQRLEPHVFRESTVSGFNIPTSRESEEKRGTPLHSYLNKIVTGHTLDDQAETVLMRLIRGAGLKGIGGIHPRIVVEDDDGETAGEIARPLLGIRRRELENYLREIGQDWREDSTNAEDHFTRNRIRKLVVPLLEREFNPAVAENLAELADIARAEEDFWENELSGWLGTTVHWSEPEWARVDRGSLVQIGNAASVESSVTNRQPQGLKPRLSPRAGRGPERPLFHAGVNNTARAREMAHDLATKVAEASWVVMNATVNRAWFLSEPLAVQRRVVKAIGEHAGIPLEFKHVEEILRVAGEASSSAKNFSLPLGWKFERRAEELVFVTPDLREPVLQRDYDYELPVPGRIEVHEAALAIEARRISDGDCAEYNPEHLLDADSLPGRLRVRNWRPGDRFWPAHTKSPKKIKELLQERHVEQADRKTWPVVVNGNEIVWLRGFIVPAKWRAKPGKPGILILDGALAGDSDAER